MEFFRIEQIRCISKKIEVEFFYSQHPILHYWILLRFSRCCKLNLCSSFALHMRRSRWMHDTQEFLQRSRRLQVKPPPQSSLGGKTEKLLRLDKLDKRFVKNSLVSLSDGSDEVLYNQSIHGRLPGRKCGRWVNEPRWCYIPKPYVCDMELDCFFGIFPSRCCEHCVEVLSYD